jgi:hypothetical protein
MTGNNSLKEPQMQQATAFESTISKILDIKTALEM